MTPSARLQGVLDLLNEIEQTPSPADALVSSYFRARRYIGSKDRAAVSQGLYNVLRHRARLGWWVEKSGMEATPRSRYLAYLVLIEKRTPVELNGLFDGKQYAPSPLSDDERALLQKLDTHTINHSSMPEDVKVECPEWAAPSLKKRFGKKFEREMEAMLDPAPLDLRVNPLKATRESVMAELVKAGIKAELCHASPFGIRIRERPSLNALTMLKEGRVEIQDEGSQLVALIVDARPGMRVVDFCAGAGGKTLAIGAQMENKGKITACDVMEKRLKRSTERFRRAGLHNIETRHLTTERDPWVKKHKASFDRVLTDAPCTGAGAWRRNPDARWRLLGPGLENLLKIQAEILDSASRLVKVGGRLIYATCSLLPEENEQQVEAFLARNPSFRVIRLADAVKEKLRSASEDYLSLTPALHDTDGFFGAVMERVGPPAAEGDPKTDADKDDDAA
jgi:16S rRNA (cytosine967-C5)-methyltransferase